MYLRFGKDSTGDAEQLLLAEAKIGTTFGTKSIEASSPIRVHCPYVRIQFNST